MMAVMKPPVSRPERWARTHELIRATAGRLLCEKGLSWPSVADVMKGAHLTEAVVTRLAEWLPALRRVPDRTKVTPRELFSLITIESICLVCLRAMAARAAANSS